MRAEASAVYTGYLNKIITFPHEHCGFITQASGWQVFDRLIQAHVTVNPWIGPSQNVLLNWVLLYQKMLSHKYLE